MSCVGRAVQPIANLAHHICLYIVHVAGAIQIVMIHDTVIVVKITNTTQPFPVGEYDWPSLVHVNIAS